MPTLPRLPAPVKRLRDAASAVKRLAGQVVQTLTTATFSQWLNLPDFEVVGYVQEQVDAQKVLHLFCAHRHAVAVCPRCHTPSTAGHDAKDRSVRDLDLARQRVCLHFRQRRFACEVCGRPFTESLVSVAPHRRQTRRLAQQIYQRCLSTNRQPVAKAAWLQEATVLDIFKHCAKPAYPPPEALTVRVLGVDEISLTKGHAQFVLVLSDLQRHCVLAVLPDRRQETFAHWLEALSPTGRAAIHDVAMDMWEPYRSVVRTQLPQAAVVADRFHVMRQLNERVSQVRRSLQAHAIPEVQVVLKGSRWVLVRNREELTPKEEAHLIAVLAACRELRTVYLLKEEFRLIFEKVPDRPQAERCLRAWLCKVEATQDKYLLKFVNTLRNWWTEILNYFIARVTNGFVEGLNRALRAIMDRAFGYRNFENFRWQVLAEHGAPSG
jgi:transposase